MIQAPLQLQPHNPDVLMCISNLSNDEVFTPPELVNQMLDTLEKSWSGANDGASIWENKDVKFLDPCTKSGVFLREIVKRLTVGLASRIPDLTERVNHILTKQVFGIAITELTSLLARRSLYCSKVANGLHSVATVFKSEEGNVWFERTEHVWDGGNCRFCGASKAEYGRSKDLETHAYAFIHSNDFKERISKMFGGNVQFDVIIGNPPYQLSDSGFGASARAIYHLFVRQAKQLDPRFMSFVIPSRWFAGGKGLDDFRQEMLGDPRIRILHDFLDSSEIFPGTDIKGGVCYFLWDRDNPGIPVVTTHENGRVIASSERPLLEQGSDIFVRFEVGLRILRKVVSTESDGGLQEDRVALADHKSFSTIVSTRKPFGIATDFRGIPAPKGKATIPIHQIGGTGYVSESDIKVGQKLISGWKVLVGYAGSGDQYPSPVIARPFLARPGSVCTETYLVIGPFKTKSEAENVLAYLSTRFARFMILLRKASQHITKAVYGYLPLQDFSIEWNDESLFKKYKLTTDEISFIEKMVKSMELDYE
jgi:hypothetical protein